MIRHLLHIQQDVLHEVVAALKEARSPHADYHDHVDHLGVVNETHTRHTRATLEHVLEEIRNIDEDANHTRNMVSYKRHCTDSLG